MKIGCGRLGCWCGQTQRYVTRMPFAYDYFSVSRAQHDRVPIENIVPNRLFGVEINHEGDAV